LNKLNDPNKKININNNLNRKWVCIYIRPTNKLLTNDSRLLLLMMRDCKLQQPPYPDLAILKSLTTRPKAHQPPAAARVEPPCFPLLPQAGHERLCCCCSLASLALLLLLPFLPSSTLSASASAREI
jgi:hypothetical protein